jgi:hypothetical protein
MEAFFSLPLFLEDIENQNKKKSKRLTGMDSVHRSAVVYLVPSPCFCFFMDMSQ